MVSLLVYNKIRRATHDIASCLAYSVLHTVETILHGSKLKEWTGSWSNGSKQWLTIPTEIGHAFGDAGEFSMGCQYSSTPVLCCSTLIDLLASDFLSTGKATGLCLCNARSYTAFIGVCIVSSASPLYVFPLYLQLKYMRSHHTCHRSSRSCPLQVGRTLL